MKARLIILDEAASTQDVVREAAERGEPEGFAVMALTQTGGRGRLGRSWVSPPGKNLALSLLLRPKFGPLYAPLMGMMLSVAAAEAVEEQGVAIVHLKWPNDVLIQGKKVAGILPEARIMRDTVEYVVLGIGMNVNTTLDDFPPELHQVVTSLLVQTGRTFSLQTLARSLLALTEAIYERVTEEGTGCLLDLWQDRWAHRGAELNRDGLIGRAVGLDTDGALLLRTDDGTLHRIHAGEVVPVSH